MRPYDYQPYRPSWHERSAWRSIVWGWVSDGLAIVATLVMVGSLTAWMFR